MKLVNLAAAALAAVAAFTMSTAAVAQNDVVVEGRPTVRVSYADLDIASKDGLATLKGRVRAAATQLCGTNSINLLRERASAEQCRDNAIAGADAQIAFAAEGSSNGATLAAAGQAGSTIAVSLR